MALVSSPFFFSFSFSLLSIFFLRASLSERLEQARLCEHRTQNKLGETGVKWPSSPFDHLAWSSPRILVSLTLLAHRLVNLELEIMNE